MYFNKKLGKDLTRKKKKKDYLMCNQNINYIRLWYTRIRKYADSKNLDIKNISIFYYNITLCDLLSFEIPILANIEY